MLPIQLQGLHVLCNTLMYMLHVYKPTARPVASHSLFLDIHKATQLLGEYTLFACVNLYYPTRMMGCGRSCTCLQPLGS